MIAGQMLVNVILVGLWSCMASRRIILWFNASMIWRGMEVIYPMAAADECAPQLCFDSDGPEWSNDMLI